MNLPNKLTIFRILLIPVFLLLVEFPLDWGTWHFLGSAIAPHLFLAALVFIFASFTDWLDGYIARRDHLVTNFGKFADPIADKMLVATALIELVTLGKSPGWVVSLILMRELAVSGLRLILVQEGEVMAAKFIGKVKTMTQMFAVIFLLVDDAPFGFLPFSIGQVLLYLALFFTLYSGFDYFIKNKKVFSDGL